MAQRLDSEALLAGLRVVDLGGEPAARAARVLGDLGAIVVRVVPPGGEVLPDRIARGVERRQARRDARSRRPRPRRAARARPTSCSTRPARRERTSSTRRAHRTRRGSASRRSGSTARARRGTRPTSGSWPRAGTCIATGDPDRAPVRCTEPAAYAHTAGEAAFAALTAVVERHAATGRRLDAGGRARREHGRARAISTRPATAAPGGARASAAPARSGPRSTASCRSGCAAARPGSRAWRRSPSSSSTTASRPTRSRARTGTPSTRTRRPTRSSTAIATAVAEYFSRHTMQELYDIACETNLCSRPRTRPRRSTRRRNSRRATSSGRSATSSGSRSSFVVVRSADGDSRTAPGPRAGVAPTAPAYPRRHARGQGHQGVGGRAHPRVRRGRGRTDRDALLLRERRDRPAHRVAYPARLPAGDGARGARQPARARRLASCTTGSTPASEPHAQPQAARRRRDRASGSSPSGPTRSPRTSRRAR